MSGNNAARDLDSDLTAMLAFALARRVDGIDAYIVNDYWMGLNYIYIGIGDRGTYWHVNEEWLDAVIPDWEGMVESARAHPSTRAEMLMMLLDVIRSLVEDERKDN